MLCAAATQGEGSLYYAGAWCGYGFHEDGLKAGMAAAVALGARVPWRARATCPKISLADSFFLGTFDRFARMAIQLGSLRLILPNGEERLYGSRQWQGPVAGEPWSHREFCTMCSSLEFLKTVAPSSRKWRLHGCTPRTVSGFAQSCSLQNRQQCLAFVSYVTNGIHRIPQLSCAYCAEDDRWLGKPPLHATVRVFEMSFFRKIITRHDTGLGEAYMDDDFDVRTTALSPATHGSAVSHPSSVITVRSQEQEPKAKTVTFLAGPELLHVLNAWLYRVLFAGG